ncbi:MAG: DUF4886 domain-containing protein [Firmicutes bacterium]|nr:DUF4886 domain-containing protein [Bacillota bacterium]
MKAFRVLVLLVVLTVAMSNISYAYTNPDTAGWFEYEVPDFNKMKGTALDASRLLDAPAGKHGHVRTEGDKLFFEDGTRVKFWGTNILSPVMFFDKKNIDKVVDAISALGYNMVRFHHMDSANRDPIIFGEGDDRQSTMALDPVMLDRFEYFWSQLKERGIYLYIDLMCSRKVNAGEVIPDNVLSGNATGEGEIISEDVRTAPGGFKGVSYYTPEVMTIAKIYATQLLTHINPYTGTTLAEDPACAVVSIKNEDSLFIESWANWSMYPTWYYEWRLDVAFDQWLAAKYGTPYFARLINKWAEPGKAAATAEEMNNGYTFKVYGCDYFSNDRNFSLARINETREFFRDLMKAYHSEMKRWLKDDLGVKALVTGSNYGVNDNNTAELTVYAESGMDAHDQHMYYGSLSGEFWLNSGVTFPRSSLDPMIKDPVRSLVTQAGIRKIYGMPYFITEWGSYLPNEYISDVNYNMAAYSALNGWNPLQFNLLNRAVFPNENVLVGALIALNNPGFLATATASAYMFNHVAETEDEYTIAALASDAVSRGYVRNYPEKAAFAGKTSIAFDTVVPSEEFSRVTADNSSFDGVTDGSVINSLTGELSMDTENGLLTVDTAKTKAAAGFIDGNTISLCGANIHSSNNYATIAVTSIDGENLGDSGNILISAMARYRNTGMEINETGTVLTQKGSEPILMEPVEGKVELDVRGNYKAYALTSSGERSSQVPVSRNAADMLVLNLSGNYKTTYYELVRVAPETPSSWIKAMVDYENESAVVEGMVEQKFGYIAFKALNPAGVPVFLDQVYSQDGGYKFQFGLNSVEDGVYTMRISPETASGARETKVSVWSDSNVGIAAFSVKEGNLNARFTTKNNFAGILARYDIDGNLMLDCRMIKSDGIKEDFDIHIPYVEGYRYKLIIWDDFQALRPLLEVQEYAEVQPKVSEKLKVLAIGNSFSVDAMEWLYDIAKDAGVREVVLGNLFSSGAALVTHWNRRNEAIYTYYKNSSGTWENAESKTLQYGLRDEDWDFIILQQKSGNSGRGSTYGAGSYLENLIAYIKANRTNPDACLGWHMTWAYPQKSTVADFNNYYEGNQMTMYNAIADAVQTVIVPHEEFDFIIPSGTAIQNLRTSYIGDTLNRDGSHLSLNIGRYTAAMTWFKTLTGMSIDGITCTPNNSGDPVPIALEKLPIIREAVNAAVENPFVVTQSSYTHP